VIDGDVEAGSLMAGQSVGLVTREQSTREILDELLAQALAGLAGRQRRRYGAALSGANLPGSPEGRDAAE